MKYRIKIVTRGTGEKTYYPQYKKFLFWRNYKRLTSIDSDGGRYYNDVAYRSSEYDVEDSLLAENRALQDAKNFIKKQVCENEESKLRSKKTISYIYI